jgi:hypothetical protein
MGLSMHKEQTNGFKIFRMRTVLEFIWKNPRHLRGNLFMGLQVLDLISQRIPL